MKRKRIAMALAGLGTVAIASGSLIAVGNEHATAHVGLVSQASVPSPSISSLTVGALPLGAVLVQRNASGRTLHYAYSLPGAANADTIPAGGITAANALLVQPATQLEVYAVAGVSSMPELPYDPANGIVRESVTVNGSPAYVTHMQNGFGTWRVDWVANDTYYTVGVQRLITSAGISGIAENALLAVADTVRSQ